MTIDLMSFKAFDKETVLGGKQRHHWPVTTWSVDSLT